MSGVEVAGIVLGAFPLAISALEHYRETAEVIGIFWKIRKEYKSWQHNLNIARLAFEQNLEEFLLPLVAEDDELQALISSPDGPEWKDAKLEERLRQRLPRSYDLYLETIGHIKSAMDEVKHELGIDKASFQKRVVEEEIESGAKSTKSSIDALLKKENYEFVTMRFKMSFRQAKREKLFQELGNYNNELRTLLDTSDRIAALRYDRKKSSISKGLWQFWRHADKLYSVLVQSWRCECRALHHANLLLQHRTTPNAEFRVMFVFASQNGKQEPWPWTCQEVNIRLLESEARPPKRSAVNFATEVSRISPQPLHPQTPSSMNSDKTLAPEVKKLSLRKSMLGILKRQRSDKSYASNTLPQHKSELLSESRMSASTLSSSSLLSGTPFAKTIAEPITDSLKTIENKDLCDIMTDYGSHQEHVTYLENDEGHLSLSPRKGIGDLVNTGDMVSLDQLLRKGSGASQTLTRHQRYLIALTLASSQLQLYSTPWITLNWTKKDIVFLRDSADSAKIHLDQPYISRNFISSPSPSRSSDRSLSNLGIMLLELCFGIALEDHEIRRKYPSIVPNAFLDMAAALEWCPLAVEEAGPEFADAIMWCLRNVPGSADSDSSFQKWRQELDSKVVSPLSYCCDQFNSIGRR